MKQKIVIKVAMHCQKCRKTAFQIVATANGVTSVELEGEEKDKVIVIGDGMDAVNLINCLRKKVGKSDIISLAEAK
ncbi:PREDICTED: heavy metal-associated isoprenylated plant protein 47 [Lupinus angustifolius]|uniref:heavy metal-associated isoprenylated plant protein 47 n=1 Tax=Lupinus angustifolius TaxID=3871 RepID=UPI00092E5923|nr:PREDICTED: heavy metal-associated isoprenylated plant protein 47 [Lupinus angustifolius]